MPGNELNEPLEGWRIRPDDVEDDWQARLVGPLENQLHVCFDDCWVKFPDFWVRDCFVPLVEERPHENRGTLAGLTSNFDIARAKDLLLVWINSHRTSLPT